LRKQYHHGDVFSGQVDLAYDFIRTCIIDVNSSRLKEAAISLRRYQHILNSEDIPDPSCYL